jgi:hypothetical protein
MIIFVPEHSINRWLNEDEDKKSQKRRNDSCLASLKALTTVRAAPIYKYFGSSQKIRRP